ncbi:hypothetical protein GLOTRDRAFT_50066 [Gloeophyllum trabeum ATCC 11539]|uniref:AMP-dependent synthetase/ligase domain-containing protein n=1 Tax=Gloeophyllum trabeum (strain ATCC 11539 / FP-39264 / Madison 617) TaxID=670483 RepID=S7PSJ5_GLOTA|nr:uncharacterized protein GLOTRDRAFT_50066 [Gloeophyllum trabeum ATCC 11539]EPQ50791.1 hypothetical protein GLOTRDRAFT_50066 [Gloeophyllum trabeum ATCC 11539]
MPLRLPPQTQALSSPTFRPPPLDGSLTLPEMYDMHYSHTPHHPLFVFADSQGVTHEILWPTAVCAVHQVGHILWPRVGSPISAGRRPIVAILAASDTITYFTVMVGIIRAGYAAFLISTRNSSAAIAHLLGKAASGLVITAFMPCTPAVAPTPENVIKGALDCESDIVFCVPSFAEAWSRNAAYVDSCLYDGGPLSKEAGDNLTREGVSVFTLYRW